MNAWQIGLVAVWTIATASLGSGCGDPEQAPVTPGAGSCGTRDCPVGYHCASEATGRCAPGCLTNGDCGAGGVCDVDTGLCGAVVSETCTDGVRNQGESGVDCGGPCAACASGCDNGVMDGDETGVDCGGACSACPDPCANGVRDGDETGVDCGGACGPCQTGATCDDGVRNETETDVDCGGTCSPCLVGRSCSVRGDCTTNVCSGGVCVAEAATCADGSKSGDETDVDCGGSCAPCGFGLGCGGGGDCGSGVCTGGTCADPTCTDGVANGFESDVDCGPGCDPCGLGKRCGFDPDCATGACEAGRCVSCDDGVRNADETDVDCGGPLCDACDEGLACLAADDCATGGCEDDICIGCGNGRRDGTETDVDCGGDCSPCAVGKVCEESADCATAACVAGRCTSPSCDDGQLNGDETDVDCGGGCEPCARDQKCAVDDDCSFGNECRQMSPGRKECDSEGTLRIAAGFQFTCAWTPRIGRVACWGDNRYGQLGTGDTTDRTSPTVVPGLVDVVELDAGDSHVCAVTRSGQVKCWGDRSWGKCGDGDVNGKILSPFTVPGLSAQKVGVGINHTCIIDAAGGLKCWGLNADGQLGIDSRESQVVPGYVVRGSAAQRTEIRAGTTELSVGDKHTCARVGGNTYCWGDRSYEQYTSSGGGSHTNDNLYPTFQQSTSYRLVTAGGRMSCFHDADGSDIMLCYGWNGWFGYPFRGYIWRSVESVACGTFECCGIVSDARLACWREETMTVIEGLPTSRYYKLAVGGTHACASNVDKGVYCWGDNQKGQLGLGRTDASGVDVAPTLVPGL